MGIIYIATNSINSKRYVGKTIKPLLVRINGHLKGGVLLFSKALRKDLKNFNFETKEYPIEKLDEMEKYWIKFYGCNWPKGYNLTDGGEGGDTWTGNPNREERSRKIRSPSEKLRELRSKNAKRQWEEKPEEDKEQWIDTIRKVVPESNRRRKGNPYKNYDMNC